MRAPSPSASVFDRGISSSRLRGFQMMCSISMPHSSDRRSAPAKPTRSKARSRRPVRSLAQVATNLCISSVASAWARLGGAPWVRPMPRSTSRIDGCRVSSGAPACRLAQAIAATLRCTRPWRNPRRERTGSRRPTRVWRACTPVRVPRTTARNASSPPCRHAPSTARRRRPGSGPLSGGTAPGPSLAYCKGAAPR